MPFVNDLKNSSTPINDSLAGNTTLVWNDLTNSWEDQEGTWDNPRIPWKRDSKNTSTITNDTKN
jgi:hypothetical protein